MRRVSSFAGSGAASDRPMRSPLHRLGDEGGERRSRTRARRAGKLRPEPTGAWRPGLAPRGQRPGARMPGPCRQSQAVMRRPRAMTRREKPRYDRRPAGRTRSARRRAAGPILLVALLLVGLAAELPLAAAVLPDLMWVRGVYDGGDYDDVLALCVDLCPSSPPP